MLEDFRRNTGMDRMRGGLAPMITVTLIMCIPIILLNFYFITHDDSPCLHQEIVKFDIDITLKTWLAIQAYVFLGIVALYTVSIIITKVSGNSSNAREFEKCADWFIIPVCLFNIAWTIVGALMYWGDLSKRHSCHTFLNIYMWINLLLGCFATALVVINIFYPRK